MFLMAVLTFVLLAVCYVNVIGQELSATVIPEGSNGTNPVIAAVENATNVELYCRVTSDGALVQTQWTLIRPGMTNTIITFQSNGLGNVGFENFFVEDNVVANSRTNFTIIKFYSTFDNTQIGCGSGGEIAARFDLKLIKPPILRQVSVPQSVIENTTFSFNIENTTGYPLLPQFTWFYNEVVISPDSTNPNISVYPYITFSSVSRSQSGNYSMIASNEGGNSTGYFILDVQYLSATSVGESQLVLSGNTVTLIAFTDIEGNPVPNVTWTGPNNTVITPGGRLNTSVDGEITITNVTNEDNGTYTCIVSNGIGSGLYQTIQLIIAVIPGPPLNVREMDVTDTTVKLTWSPPNELGTPTVSYYHVVMIPRPPSDVILNTTNTTLIIWGIIPSTTYNVSVIAVAMGETIGLLTSQPSDLLTFMTMRGAPMFQTVNVIPSNGNINISWRFRHTGGQDIDDVEVYCVIDGEGSSNQLYNMLSCSNITGCVDDKLMGSTSVGPVFAGERYYCSITAINTNGTDMRNISNIISTEGIPSIPELISNTSSPGQVTLEVRTRSPGDNTSFQFNVTVIITADNSIARIESFSFMKYISNTIVSLTIVLTNGGSFSFNIVTTNQYGTSEAISTGEIIIQPTTQTTTTPIITTSTVGPSTTPTTTIVPSISITVSATPTTSPPTETRPSGLSGGAIAGIVIAIIILIAIAVLVGLIIFYILYKNKGDSYQVERGGGGKGKGVTVEELDIDIGTELKGTSSGGGGSQIDQPSTEKPELHYADLEHFQRKPQQGGQHVSDSKPQPIQEVHYAEIKPQDATQTSAT